MDYIDRVSDGRSPVAERRVLGHAERYEDALFMGLRLAEGLDLPVIEARYGSDVWGRYGHELARAVDAGLLVHEPGRRIRLTRAGMLVANDVMAVFIGPPVR
jgi:oxygen-independent coproporphyrinogen-3 oxidase